MEDTGKFFGIPEIILQLDDGFPISSFTNSPPLTPPAKTLWLRLSFGSHKTPLVLPEILLGPFWTHAISGLSPGTPSFLIDLKSSCSSWTLNRFSVLGLPSTGSIVNSQSSSLYAFGGSSSFFLSCLLSFFVLVNGLLDKFSKCIFFSKSYLEFWLLKINKHVTNNRDAIIRGFGFLRFI